MRRKKILLAAACCWWIIVLAITYWIEKKLFGDVFVCGAVTILIDSAIIAIVFLTGGFAEERTKPVLPPWVLWILDILLAAAISYIVVEHVFLNGKWGNLLLLAEGTAFLLIIVWTQLYKKIHSCEPSETKTVFLLGALFLIGLFLTIQISGIRTVSSMRTMLEEEGYTRIIYKGEQSYHLLSVLYGDEPELELSDPSSEHPDGDLREMNTGLYLYSGRKNAKEYALFVSPVTGRMIAALPLESHPAYEGVLHGN